MVSGQDLRTFSPLVLNVFENDRGFIDVLMSLVDEKEGKRLKAILGGWEKEFPRWNDLAAEVARPEKHPRIEKYDRSGNRVERVVLPLETKTIRREVVERGIWESKTNLEKFSKVYLLAKLGESGVTCPLACTDGLVRVIDAIGSPFLKEHYLPKLKSAEFPLAGAQFVTEQTGGSDVGAIEGMASENGDGSWSITAEKWFCSACDEFFLVCARPDGSAAGTEGLAIFFVPREIDGKPNRLSYRRLKNKLGTQSLPTAEIDLEGSKGWLIGKKEEGFHNLMNYILNVSRIHNAANSLGLLGRAFAEARNYALQRVAFGKPLVGHPLIQKSLLDLMADLSANRSLFFGLVKRIDDSGLLSEKIEEGFWTRFLINLLKYRTAVRAASSVKEAILICGANGIVEDFSILPRLLRDSLIVETWEGPHNVLCLQILRDASRFDFFGRLHSRFDEIVSCWPTDVLAETKKIYVGAVSESKKFLTAGKLKDSRWVQRHAREAVDHWGGLLAAGGLLEQGFRRKSGRDLALAAWLVRKEFGAKGLAGDGNFEESVLSVAAGVIADQEVQLTLTDL